MIPLPGDLLIVRTGSFAAAMIRLGAALAGQPNLANHVAIVHHRDAAGTLWTLEGRPGGVGWRDAADYLRSTWTVTNVAQPKTAAQRQAVCDTAHAMIGTPYAWAAIIADAGMAFGLKDIWAEKTGGALPGQVVCSSLAGVTRPGGGNPRNRLSGMSGCLVDVGRGLGGVAGQHLEHQVIVWLGAEVTYPDDAAAYREPGQAVEHGVGQRSRQVWRRVKAYRRRIHHVDAVRAVGHQRLTMQRTAGEQHSPAHALKSRGTTSGHRQPQEALHC